MDINELYLKQNSTVPSASGITSEYDDEIKKAVDRRDYDVLFDTAVQNYNVYRQAQNQLDTTMKQQGLEGSGAGLNSSAMLNNAYLNANANALGNYRDANVSALNDAYTRYMNTENEDANKLSTAESYIQQAYETGNYTLANQLIDQYRNEFSGEALDNFNTFLGIGNYYTNNPELISGTGFSGKDEIKEIKTMQNGNVKSLKDFVTNEVDNMFNWVETGNVTEPTIFRLENANENEGHAYIYYDPSSKMYYYLSDNVAKKYVGNGVSMLSFKSMDQKIPN